MQFVGEGYLVSVSSYQKRDGEDLKTFYKYSFLVGDTDADGKYLFNASVQTSVSDHPLLKGGENFMSKVKIIVTIKTEFEKDGVGKYRQVQRPTYSLADMTK